MSNEQAKTGDMVRLHFTLFSNDGVELDSSHQGEPIEFQLGAGTILPALEEAIPGMSVGDHLKVDLTSENAFGGYNAELVHNIPREALSPDVDVAPGARLQAKGPNGHMFVVTVMESDEEVVKVDANHPLAGVDVVFELELLAIM